MGFMAWLPQYTAPHQRPIWYSARTHDRCGVSTWGALSFAPFSLIVQLPDDREPVSPFVAIVLLTRILTVS